MGDYDYQSVYSDIEDIAQSVVDSLLPEKSKQTCEQSYARLEDWSKGKGIKNSSNDKIVLAYFEYLTEHSKSSSLWVYYSMIRSIIVNEEKYGYY